LSITIIRIVDTNNRHYLFISTLRIADINNAICGYRQLVLSISLIPIVYRLIGIIAFMYYWYRQYRQLELSISVMYVHYWYPKCQLSVSLMRNHKNTNCWYQQIIVDIDTSNSQYPQFQLSISLMHNRNNTNCINSSNCGYRQFEMSISRDVSRLASLQINK